MRATAWPRAASAVARFTVTVLLPTPPLPLATAMVRVRDPGPKSDWTSWSRWRRRPASASRSSHDMASSLTSTVRPAGDRCQRLLGVGAYLVPQRAAGGREHDGRADARIVEDDVADHAEVDDVALELRVFDARERAQHVFVGHACLRGRIGLSCVPARRAAQSAGRHRISRASPRTASRRRSRTRQMLFRGSSQHSCTMTVERRDQAHSSAGRVTGIGRAEVRTERSDR